MRIPRLLPLSLVVAGCVVSALAQSAGRVSKASPSPPAFSVQDFMAAAVPPVLHPAKVETPDAQQESACYTIRDYRFSRKSSQSAAPKLKDYSTCERASLFHELEVIAPAKGSSRSSLK
jgi:hypothetical protein